MGFSRLRPLRASSFKTEQRVGNLPPRCILFLCLSRARNKRETRFDLYPESWTFFKRDSVISGIELDSCNLVWHECDHYCSNECIHVSHLQGVQ